MLTDSSENVWVSVQSAAPAGAVPSWKRVLDFGCIFILIPLWLPVMVAIAVLIKLCSKGPVFFRQERIGHGAKPFICLKFRTMHVQASTDEHQKLTAQLLQSDAPMTKLDLKGDRRLIAVAPLLRSTGLDELPQLINVIRGEMSLVGPRPCVRYEYEQYLPWQKQRFATLPGLTGLWQVSGKNRTTFTQMIRLDIEYIEKMSFWLDLKIMLKTAPALIGQVLESKLNKGKQQ